MDENLFWKKIIFLKTGKAAKIKCYSVVCYFHFFCFFCHHLEVACINFRIWNQQHNKTLFKKEVSYLESDIAPSSVEDNFNF